MPTDNLKLEITTEQINTGYEPSYTPLFPILTRQKKHTAIVGKHTLQQSRIIGDAKARIIETQDTEWKHAKTGPANKDFNKFMKGIKHIVSGYQSTANLQNTANELLDINLQAFDEDVFNGDPTVGGELRNNGLWKSNDPDYRVLGSTALPANPTQDQLKEILDNMLSEAEATTGNAPKVFVSTRSVGKYLGRFVGTTAVTWAAAFTQSYKDAEGLDVSFVTAPKNLTSEDGILLLTPSQLTLNYIEVPHIRGRGYNDEDVYTWLAEEHGSSSIDVDKKNAIVKQPVTFS